jgi:putative DNA primase/helicase
MTLSPQRIIQDSPPRPLPVEPNGIPEELRIRPQWVNWKYARKDEKWTKHPYDPVTRRMASSTDLMTWRPFEEVFRAYEAGNYGGVGFVFCSGDPYTGVDLDGCRDSQTGEIEPWASQIIEGLDSYAELSPSGAGVHVIVKGKAPTPVKRSRVEIYSIERFFTFTGHPA